MNLKAPCPGNRCDFTRETGKHSAEVLTCSQAERNSIPELLVGAEIDAWIARTPWASKRLFIDVFHGFGSVGKAVSKRREGIHVYSNEWVHGRGSSIELDMSKYDLSMLLAFALNKTFVGEYGELPPMNGDGVPGMKHWMQQQSIAVLFHLSTPCETYSTAAGSVHRDAGRVVPKTTPAGAHDTMNAAFVSWFSEHAL